MSGYRKGRATSALSGEELEYSQRFFISISTKYFVTILYTYYTELRPRMFQSVNRSMSMGIYPPRASSNQETLVRIQAETQKRFITDTYMHAHTLLIVATVPHSW